MKTGERGSVEVVIRRGERAGRSFPRLVNGMMHRATVLGLAALVIVASSGRGPPAVGGGFAVDGRRQGLESAPTDSEQPSGEARSVPVRSAEADAGKSEEQGVPPRSSVPLSQGVNQPATIVVSKRAQELAGISAAPLEPTTHRETVRAYGTVLGLEKLAGLRESYARDRAEVGGSRPAPVRQGELRQVAHTLFAGPEHLGKRSSDRRGRVAFRKGRLRGLAFFYTTARNAGILPGMNVTAFLAVGEEVEGVLLPASAIVWWQGRPWAYVQTGADRFTRRVVEDYVPGPTRWFVRRGFSSGERIAVTGAQLLLSRELESQIQGGD